MKFEYNHEKNAKLLAQRSIGFDEIIQCIADGHLVRITNHHNEQDYPNQKIMHVKVLNQIYLVPYVRKQDDTIFLKTFYKRAKQGLINLSLQTVNKQNSFF